MSDREPIQMEPGLTLREVAELSGQEQYQLRHWTHTILIREVSRKRRLAIRQRMERSHYERDCPDKYL